MLRHYHNIFYSISFYSNIYHNIHFIPLKEKKLLFTDNKCFKKIKLTREFIIESVDFFFFDKYRFIVHFYCDIVTSSLTRITRALSFSHHMTFIEQTQSQHLQVRLPPSLRETFTSSRSQRLLWL